MNTCAICYEKTDRIKSRCSCGDASIVCEDCFCNYWNLDCCEFKDFFLPEFKCLICRNVDKRQQLTHIFTDVYYTNYNHFLKGKMKIIKFLENKLDVVLDKYFNTSCDICAELWDDCTCLCHNCDSDYKVCKGECY